MTHIAVPKNTEEFSQNEKSKSFVNIAIGLFFLVSTAALVVVLMMFIFVWQPIWSDGFKDFHTISNAIKKLDTTARPATDAIPIMLNEMTQMNKSMSEMVFIMKEMDQSIGVMKEMTPNMQKMTLQLERMSYLVGRIERKLPSTDRIPFW